MVQRSLPFVLLAGLLSCKGDPTDSLRNGVNQLLADPSQIILDSATTQAVIVSAQDEQGNSVTAKFSATATAGITVRFDSTYNRVYDANGKLKPQNPATQVRYIVGGNVIGNASVTVSGGGKEVTIPVRIPPTGLAATISNTAPNPGETITITLPAPAKFAFDPADTNSIGVTIGGLKCQIVTVTADSTGVGCIPLPGSDGKPSLRNVLPGFGNLGPITVSALTTVKLPLPTLTITPANPQAGDTVRIIVPAPYKLGATSPDTSGVSIGTGVVVRTVRTADSVKFLIGPGGSGTVSVNRLRIPNFGGASNLFTASTAAVTTPALPVLAANKTGALTVGDTVTVTSTAKYRFTPASTVLIPSTIPGVTVGAKIASVSTDSLTLKYVIGYNASNAPVSINNVRLSGATGLGIFTLATTSTLSTAALTQFPATFSNQTPAPNEAVTITAGAGFSFAAGAQVLTGTSIVRPAFIVGQTATTITFLPIPNTGKSKPVVRGVIDNNFPGSVSNLPAAAYLTASSGTKTITPTGILDATNSDPSLTPFLPTPAAGTSLSVVDAGTYPSSSLCSAATGGNGCRIYRIHVDAGSTTLDFRARWAGPGDANGDGLEDGNRKDGSLYFLLPDGSDYADPVAAFDCDSFGGGTSAAGVPRGVSGEACTQNFPGPGDYIVLFALFNSTNAANNVNPFELLIDITNP